VIEEKELHVRFGEKYLRYAEQVPRIIPRLISATRETPPPRA
jgi:protein-S-isoprenylcysteine O-methyltransferase Ste14